MGELSTLVVLWCWRNWPYKFSIYLGDFSLPVWMPMINSLSMGVQRIDGISGIIITNKKWNGIPNPACHFPPCLMPSAWLQSPLTIQSQIFANWSVHSWVITCNNVCMMSQIAIITALCQFINTWRDQLSSQLPCARHDMGSQIKDRRKQALLFPFYI